MVPCWLYLSLLIFYLCPHNRALSEPIPPSLCAPPPPPCPSPPLDALSRLRPVDVGFMKALHEKVNIVPLIAKADCLVPSEIRKLKERVSLLCVTAGPGLGLWDPQHQVC